MSSWLGTNQPPELEIVGARADRAHAAGVRVTWSARDPDGRVVESRWRLDAWNTQPSLVAGAHATTTDECLVPMTELSTARASTTVQEPQRFTLWAIDDRGAASVPATLAIWASGNIAPTVLITSPTPTALLRAQVSHDLCINWDGIDPDGVFTQKPVKYKFRLLDLNDPNNLVFLANPDSLRRLAVETNWAGWDSTSAETTFVHYSFLVPTKSYLFTVTGWDEAGDYDPVFSLNKNMLQFDVQFPQALGPIMSVTSTSLRFQFQSGGGLDDPGREISFEAGAGGTIPFDWSAIPVPGQSITGYRWVLDPRDPHDETPRTGPDDVHHWSEWTMTPSVTLGPFSAPGFKRAEHKAYLEARSGAGTCSGAGTDFASAAIMHFVVVEPSFAKDLLIVDDTRLEVDKFAPTGCPNTYTQRWPSAAELDTFLYAHGGVPWRCTKNPPSGVTTIPGLFAGYAFDTLGTRGVLSGPQFGEPDSRQFTVPLSVLASYRHVLWLTDGPAAILHDVIQDPLTPTTALRFMSERGRVNVLSAYVKMGGQLWLAGGGTATASLVPWDRTSNNTGGITRFTSLPPFLELAPGGMVWESVHVRSEISVANAIQASRALGRFESVPGAYGALPPLLESRNTGTDPLPPTRLGSQGSLFYLSTRQVEFITQPNVILEDVDPDPGVVNEQSVLDSLYVVQGSTVPVGTGNVAMTVYHGADNARCIWTGFDLWSFQRSECIALVDGVLQGIWGLPRAPVVRGPSAAPGFATAAPPAYRTPAMSRTLLRPRPVR